MSRFIAKAIEHELERELLRAYLDELDEGFGPGPPALAGISLAG